MRLLLIHLCVIASSVLAQSEAVLEPTFKDVSYGPHERNRLDVWQANGAAPTPLLIFIHGGGWAGGDKADMPTKLRSFMLAKGVSVASINYRYSTQAILPAPVHDAAKAVQFLRFRSAEWRLDTQRFGAYGISAGATTTLWLACHDDLADPSSVDLVSRQSTRLQAAVGLSPQPSLVPATVVSWVGDQVLQHPMIARAVGARKLEDVKDPGAAWLKLLHEFSSIEHLSAGDPPVLISNPRVDPLPATSAGSAIHHAVFGSKFQERAHALGLTCILRIQDKADATIPTPEEFLLKHLGR